MKRTFLNSPSVESFRYEHQKIINSDFSITTFDKSKPGYTDINDFFTKGMVGPYFLYETLGCGSFSRVHRGKNGDREVAVKIVNRFSKSSKESQRKRDQRIYREILIGILTEHDNIARILDLYYNEYYIYLVFEYVDGCALLDIISKNGALSERKAFEYFSQLIKATEYLHNNNIVHRDLKIENILIADKLKLIDFGLSNFFDNKNRLQTFCGSLYFAAPELIKGVEYFGPEVDIWALGIVLYVMVNGSVPFDDTIVKNLHEKIRNIDFTMQKDISVECENLIRQMVIDMRDRIGVDDIKKSDWYSHFNKENTDLNNFNKNNAPKSKKEPYLELNYTYIKILKPILSYDIPHYEKHLEQYFIHRNKFLEHSPAVSLYRMMEKCFSGILLNVDENLNCEESLHSLLDQRNKLDIFYKTYLKGILKSDSHINLAQRDDLNKKSHKDLRKKLTNFLDQKNIAYRAKNRSFLCSTNRLEFKITLYCNILVKKYFLSITRLKGEKKRFSQFISHMRNEIGE